MRVSNERVGTLIKINEGLDPWCVRRLAEDLRDEREALGALRAVVEKEAVKLYARGHYSWAINLRKLLNEVEDSESE